MLKNIIFDLDGTIVLTAGDIIFSLNYALKNAGVRKKIKYKDFKKVASKGSVKMIQNVLKKSSSKSIKKINQLFLQHYQENICVKSRLKKNVSQLLKLCKKKKIKLFISTNKSGRNAKLLLKKLNILDYFLFVAGSDSFKFKKPNPIHLKTLYKKFKIDKNQSIMIGDSKIDAECAKKNGTKFILVKNGYTNIHNNKIFSNFKVNNFKEIIKIVKNLTNKNS